MRAVDELKGIEQRILQDIEDKKKLSETEIKNFEKEKKEEMESRWSLVEKEMRIEMERDISTLKNRIVSTANLEVRKDMWKAKEDVIQSVRERLIESMKSMSREEYAKFLLRCVKRASEELGSNITIHASAKDVPMVSSIANSMGLDSEIKEDAGVSNGIVATTRDGKITLVETVEEIIDRRWAEIRMLLANKIFK